MIIRLDPPIWLETPKGQALCHFLIDRGIEFDNEWVCFHNNGEIWNWLNYDVRVARNVTIGRTHLSAINGEPFMAMSKRKFERSAADKAKDRREAKKRGISTKQFEGSAADEKMDRALMKRVGKRKK